MQGHGRPCDRAGKPRGGRRSGGRGKVGSPALSLINAPLQPAPRSSLPTAEHTGFRGRCAHLDAEAAEGHLADPTAVPLLAGVSALKTGAARHLYFACLGPGKPSRSPVPPAPRPPPPGGPNQEDRTVNSNCRAHWFICSRPGPGSGSQKSSTARPKGLSERQASRPCPPSEWPGCDL